MKWFYQKKGWGLGNFVMATPALKLLYEKNKEKINVYFDNKQIEQLYLNCYFMNILKFKPSNKWFSSSKRPKRLKTESDSEALCRILCNCRKNIPNTYVDNVKEKILSADSNYVAVFHGCLNKRTMKKDLGGENRQLIIRLLLEHNYIPVILGNGSDYNNFWYKNKLGYPIINCLGKYSLRDSVAILNQCKFFISNDTGLYHVAGALKKQGLVFWKETSPVKNKCVFDKIKHVINKNNNSKVILDETVKFLKSINGN